MARITKPLTATEIDNAQKAEKQYKLYDGNGLSIVIFPNGKKKWRYEYTFDKKRNSLSLGGYPEIKLKTAREKTGEYNDKKNNGIDPKSKNIELKTLNIKELIQEYLETRIDWSEVTRVDMIQRIEKNIYPFIGDIQIDKITKKDIIDTLLIMEKRGATENGKKVFSLLNMTFKYASTLQKIERNILADIDRNLLFTKKKKTNFAHTTDPKILKEILLAIDDYQGELNSKVGLQLLPFLFVRPYPLRHMEWKEIDLDKKIWSIPKDKMKTDIDFIVPLSDYVVNILKKHSSESHYVLNSLISRTRPLSENTFNFGLKRMGFNITAHGFRHTASTILHENIHIHKIPSEVIEIQLGHKVGNSVHRTYNKAQYIEERTRLMNWWSDYLIDLKNS
ncbi:MAG: tyrosine-type recombinase/integrase [Campylobacterota bacterium]|nr:tyrosine-type recombinase/integrase [Campylobacterota bacterium]